MQIMGCPVIIACDICRNQVIGMLAVRALDRNGQITFFKYPQVGFLTAFASNIKFALAVIEERKIEFRNLFCCN